jgi:hypothetical protein
MILRNSILAFLILILTAQCTDERSDVTDTHAKIDYKPQLNFAYNFLHPTSYYGEWSYSFPFYTTELFINRDGTFMFHDQGCMGHGYSEGRWLYCGTGILLTSFEKYATHKPLAVEIKPGPVHSTLKRKRIKNKIEYTLDPAIFNTVVTYGFSPVDTSNVYFNNAQFRLEGDTLYRLDKHGSRGDAFILTKTL